MVRGGHSAFCGSEGPAAALLVSPDAKFARPTRLPIIRASSNDHNLVSFAVENLKPDTRYYYALEVDGRVERRKRGAFRTFPVSNRASFAFAYGSCARTGSTLDTFDRIRELRPLFFMNVGDFHYLNITNDDVGKFRAAYDTVLASPQQADLY